MVPNSDPGVCTVVRLYRHTGDEDLLEFVGQVIKHYPPIQRMRSSGEPEMAHGYMLCAAPGGAAEYAHVTGEYEILAWVENVWERRFVPCFDWRKRRISRNRSEPTGEAPSGADSMADRILNSLS